MKFYPRAWAKYQEAIPGTLKLTPPEFRYEALAADYDAMRDMLYVIIVLQLSLQCDTLNNCETLENLN